MSAGRFFLVPMDLPNPWVLSRPVDKLRMLTSKDLIYAARDVLHL